MKKRRMQSMQTLLLAKSREAALHAVQAFNNPFTTFKSETFIVNMIIAWTYLLHAYYRREKVEYRHYDVVNVRRRFQRTETGAVKYWSLRTCIGAKECPLDKPTKANLFFLIGLRDEIEHRMCLGLDERMSARYFACCLNYEAVIKKMFGERYSLEQDVAITLQFSHHLLQPPDEEVTEVPLPSNVVKYVQQFDDSLSPDVMQSPQFAVRLIFTRKLVNHPGQADRAIEFVAPDSDVGDAINKQYVVIREREKRKLGAKEVVKIIRDEGYPRFGPYQHTQFWKRVDGKNPDHEYGAEVGGHWFWYENWLEVVRAECQEHPDLYGPIPELGISA